MLVHWCVNNTKSYGFEADTFFCILDCDFRITVFKPPFVIIESEPLSPAVITAIRIVSLCLSFGLKLLTAGHVLPPATKSLALPVNLFCDVLRITCGRGNQARGY